MGKSIFFHPGCRAGLTVALVQLVILLTCCEFWLWSWKCVLMTRLISTRKKKLRTISTGYDYIRTVFRTVWQYAVQWEILKTYGFDDNVLHAGPIHKMCGKRIYEIIIRPSELLPLTPGRRPLIEWRAVFLNSDTTALLRSELILSFSEPLCELQLKQCNVSCVCTASVSSS